MPKRDHYLSRIRQTLRQANKLHAWPRSADVLRAGDIRKDVKRSYDQRSLLSEINEWLEGHYLYKSCAEKLLLQVVLLDPGGLNKVPRNDFDRMDILRMNDSPRNSKKELARAWNRMTALLGYLNNNPEAAWAEGILEELEAGKPNPVCT